MAGKVGRSPLARLVSLVTPMAGRGLCRSREKQLLLLALATISLLCFGSVWFLPDRSGPGGKVKKAWETINEAINEGAAEVLAPPPIHEPGHVGRAAGLNNKQNKAQIPKPDNLEFKKKVVNDEEIASILKQQEKQVLPKPNQRKDTDKKSSSSAPQPLDNKFAKPGVKPGAGGGVGPPCISGGEDKDSEARQRRDHVRGMMKHAWDNYVTYAWGKNELRPVSKRGHTASIFGVSSMGATIVDSLDTLYIMGLQEDFDKGKEWVAANLDMNQMSGDVSVFETNIRYVGGLLTAYSFTGDEMFKEKAVHIVDKLLPAFDTPTGIPYALVNMRAGTAKNFGWASGGSSILSEFGTLHMEFAYLSDITGNPVYKQKVERIRRTIQSVERPKKLYPNYLHPKTGRWGQQHTSGGALGGSFYEYLLKEWLRSGKRDTEAKRMFDEAALDIEQNLVQTSSSGLTYIAEWKYGRLEQKMDHLACFAGGMYGLAAKEEQDSNSERWMEIAKVI